MNSTYPKETWNRYARNFLAVNPLSMLILNKAVAEFAFGHVCDFGCGAAKIAPFILNNPNVDSYTGIDYSQEMVEQARWHVKQFPEKPSDIIQGKIESINIDAYEFEIISGKTETIIETAYNFGLSINSYYSWDNPEQVLQCIYKTLPVGAHFILVTPNPDIDMPALLKEAKRELAAHPYFDSFSEQNIALANNDGALFPTMDLLIEKVRKVGFKIIEANQTYYNQGLNMIRMIK